MAITFCRPERPAFPCVSVFWACLVLLAALLPTRAAAFVRPLEGGGDFHTSVDVINRWISEDQLDVMVLVEVANADLKFEQEELGFVARMRVEVQLQSLDGRVVKRKRQIRTPSISAADAAAGTQNQVFGVLLADVPFDAGRLTCVVYDAQQRQAGILRRSQRRSQAAGEWAAETTPRPPRGVALGDPLFLMQAPLAGWKPGVIADKEEKSGWLQDYVHPSRRYGLEQDRLQIFVPVWPQAGGIPLTDEPMGLRVEVSNLDMDFVLRDSVRFDERGRAVLASGAPAGLFYELDVNLLPEGAYHLSLAPLSGQGRACLTGFDVIWRLAALGRHRSQVLGEGRTVFSGRDLAGFLKTTPAEQEKMLSDFWAARNPDPESPLNAAYVEFQYRLAYVKRFLRGFDEFGARDPRGELYLLMGRPDEIQRDHIPMNFRDQDDARIKVYQRFAPDREGSTAKGSPIGGQDNINPYQVEGGIPMPYSDSAERDRQASISSPTHVGGFELWKYDDGGNPLFPNRFSDKGMGQRFLFVDRTGGGEYQLESSNVVQLEE